MTLPRVGIKKPKRPEEPIAPELPAIDEDALLQSVDTLYPEIAQRARSSVDVLREVRDFATIDPDAFLADIKTKGRTRDTEIMLQGFGFKGEQIDEVFPEPPSDEEMAEILRVGDVSDEEINRIILERRTTVPKAIVGRISFLTDPAGWWERRHEEYVSNVPLEQKAAALRRETLANTEGIIGLVNSPLWRGGLAITDIAGIALLTYSGLQAARVGWQFLVRTFTMRQAQQMAGGRVPKDTLNSFVDTIMGDKVTQRMMGRQFVDSIFRRTPKGFQASPEAVSRMEEEIVALIRSRVSSIIPRGTQTGALAFGGLPAQPGVLTVAIWNAMTAAQRLVSAERAGLETTVGEKGFELLTEAEKSAMAKVIPETAPDIVPPTAFEAGLQRELVKEGFSAPAPEAVPESVLSSPMPPIGEDTLEANTQRIKALYVEKNQIEREVINGTEYLRTPLASEMPKLQALYDRLSLEGKRGDALGAPEVHATIAREQREVAVSLEPTPPAVEAVAEVPAEVVLKAELEAIAPPPSVPPTPVEAKIATNALIVRDVAEQIGAVPVEDVVAKLTQLIRNAEPARDATEKLKHDELVRRTGKAAGILNTAEGREAFRKSKSALVGELPKADFAPPELQLTDSDITGLFNQIKDADIRYFEKLNTAEALETLLSGNIPTRGDIQLLEKMFGPELAKAILDKRPLGTKIWETVLDVLNLPRAVLSSWDLSAPLRQGAPLFWGQPKQSIPAFAPMMKAAFSSKNAKLIDGIGRTSKYAQLREDAGLFEAPLYGVSAKLEQREEAFMSRLARYIPLVSASERAYVTYLNVLRRNVFDSYAAHWEGTGKTMKDYKSLASVINILSGRGPLGKLSGMGGILNATFFSPRYQAAKIALPVEFLRATPPVRKMMARNILAFVAINLTILALIKFAGGSVEEDPRSADFGKGKIGNTRLDFWAGFQQYARTIAQMITEIRKTSTTGRLTEVERSEILSRFIRGKLSPVAGFVADILEGESFMGEELSLEPTAIQEQAFNRLVPMFMQDLVEAIEDSGITGALTAMPGMFGVGVQTYGGGYWEQFIDQLGQPQVTDTLPYSANEADVYTTRNLWSDVQRRIKGIDVKDMTDAFGFPEMVRTIGKARDTKEVYQQRPNVDLVKINADISEGDTFEHFFLQWQDYQRASDKEQWLEDTGYDKYYMGNFSRRALDLLRQYHKLDKVGQENFLEQLSEVDRTLLTTDARDEWLKSRPAANAELAIWGQAKLLSMEAYNKAKELLIKLDIPDSAVKDILPSEDIAETYFQLSDSRRSDVLKSGTTKEIAELYLEYSEIYSSGEKGAQTKARDFRKANDILQQWGEINLGWKPLESKATTPTTAPGIRAFEGLLRAPPILEDKQKLIDDIRAFGEEAFVGAMENFNLDPVNPQPEDIDEGTYLELVKVLERLRAGSGAGRDITRRTEADRIKIAEEKLPEVRAEWLDKWGVTEVGRERFENYPIEVVPRSEEATASYSRRQKLIRMSPGYVNPSTLAHEIAHANFYEQLSEQQRKAVALVLDYLYLNVPSFKKEVALAVRKGGSLYKSAAEKYALFYDAFNNEPDKMPYYISAYYYGLIPPSEPGGLGMRRWLEREGMIDFYKEPFK